MYAVNNRESITPLKSIGQNTSGISIDFDTCMYVG